MGQLLRAGQLVITQPSGLVCTVGRFLGGGGQGEVYAADLSGQPVALKWYFPEQATAAHHAALETLVKQGAPTDRFLWPLELAAAAGVAQYGYVMPLRPDRFRSIVDLMARRVEPSFRALATSGLELADSFLQLHARGLCYRDISFGNIFFDPGNGEVLICDNDNVSVDGQGIAGVLGTPDFMAPEVVRGEAFPSSRTDLYSLAVLLFYMCCLHHPLYGKKVLQIRCLDLPARTKLCGTEPLFIFDPADRSNEALPRSQDPYGEAGDNALAFWPIYPRFLRDLFTQAFTAGLHDAENGRVREGQWRAAMVRLRDSIMYCAGCSAENFYDPDRLREAAEAPRCWACLRSVAVPARIRLGRGIVMLNVDTKLYPHHVDEQRMYDFSAPVAEVSRHPTNPLLWGLKNLGSAPWQATLAGSGEREVQPGQNVPIADGTKIQFGRSEGEIRA